MPPDESDVARLWEMLDAARKVVELTTGMTFEQYLEEWSKRWSIERAIEIVGEAARQVSRDCQDAHPEIPWRKIVAQRHVLAHEYGRINHELIWRVVTVHVPA